MSLTHVDPQHSSTTDPSLDETPIMDELQDILKNPDEWLDEPNDQFGGRPPRALIGIPDEQLLRNMIRAVKHGLLP